MKIKITAALLEIALALDQLLLHRNVIIYTIYHMSNIPTQLIGFAYIYEIFQFFVLRTHTVPNKS